jgi:hypothetical protein
MKTIPILLNLVLTMEENLPDWFLKARNISAELAIGFGSALVVLRYWLHDLMNQKQFDLALAIIIPFFLLTLVLSCSKAIDALKKINQQSNHGK